MKKMCWFCQHFDYEVEDTGMGSAQTGAWGDSFAIGCKKGEWELDVREDSKILFARNLQKADSCEFFELDENVATEIEGK